MNEPQLSAEMEKRFEHYAKIKCPWCLGQEEEHCHCDGYGVVSIAYVVATALEEQRKKDLSFLKEMREYAGTPTDLVKWEMVVKMIEDWIAELESTLNGKTE